MLISFALTLNTQQITKNILSYFYYNIPKLISIFPSGGSLSGNTEVFLKGIELNPFSNLNKTKYDKNSVIKFGNKNVKAYIVNETSIKLFSPPSKTLRKDLIQVILNFF